MSTRLEPAADARRDHTLGGADAPITLVEYGSFCCPHCRAAHDVIASLRERFGERMRYVFRHRPLTGNDAALRAAELVEYAAETTGQYWEAHYALMRRGIALGEDDFAAVASELGLPALDTDSDAWRHARARVREDIASARTNDVAFVPTLYINGRRYEGPWDESSLAEAMTGSLGHRMQTAALDFASWAPSTGLLLLTMTLLAILLTNSPLGSAFTALWHMPVVFSVGGAEFGLSLHTWINDGLLTIFFVVVGLEIKREFTVGRLSTPRAAALPFSAAAGGMLVPACIYLLIAPTAFRHGWAIPTTTDTAFSVALIALLGRRVPVELRIFLTAAVIVDDLAAIAILGVFYSTGLDAGYLALAALVTALLVALNKSGVYRALPYGLLGIALWICLHHGGLHATLAGVILAAATPTRPPANLNALMTQAKSVVEHEVSAAPEPAAEQHLSEPALRAIDAIHDRMESPAAKLLRSIEPWSSYVVLPVFALANAGLAFTDMQFAGHERLIAAITLGLVIGKPAGMLAFAALAVWIGLAVKPAAYTWRQLGGATAMAGIGFTMSLYIAEKTFAAPADFAAAKLAIFTASLIAGAIGTAWLWAPGAGKVRPPSDARA